MTEATAANGAPDGTRRPGYYHNHGQPIRMGRRLFKKVRASAKAIAKADLRRLKKGQGRDRL